MVLHKEALQLGAGAQRACKGLFSPHRDLQAQDNIMLSVLALARRLLFIFRFSEFVQLPQFY